MSYWRRIRKAEQKPKRKRRKQQRQEPKRIGPIDPASNKIICVGIDPSLRGTGIATVTDGNAVIDYHGWTDKITTQKRFSDSLSFISLADDTMISRTHRVQALADWAIKYACEYNRPGYDLFVAIEGYAMAARSSRATDLHELCGLIKVGLWDRGIPFRIYDPSSIKLAWTGNGNADKSLMTMTVFRELGIDCTPMGEAGSNIADAILIASLLYFEVACKRGEIEIKTLSKELRRVLLRTTKAAPEAALTRPFIHRNALATPRIIAGGG